MISAGADPEGGGALFDDTRRRSEELDPEKAVSIFYLEGSGGLASEEDGLPAGRFWARLPPAWEADRILPANHCVNEASTDPGVAFYSSGRADLENRAVTRIIFSGPGGFG